MNKEDTMSRLQAIFRQVFNEPELIINESTSAAEIASWTSLNHVILIDRIEKRFGVKFDLEDMLSMETAGDICKSLDVKLENA